ncbi:type III restriction enzyme, res subunit [Bacteroidales bacterium KA00251]|nr:type III restriction enzyme, res subunit [Bacteroidales bacterium KA00251]
MKIQYKHQAFQKEAAEAVVNVFCGQPRVEEFGLTSTTTRGLRLATKVFCNNPIVLNEQQLKKNVQEIQEQQQLKPIDKLQLLAKKTLALSIEMETGTGKTYTYIKTMYELHKQYGWTKFIIVVPSVAIREGVLKSLSSTADHFAEEYGGERMQYFVYDSNNLTAIDQFCSDAKIQVMVINTQAFNATGTDARRITSKQESFNWRRPIDVLAETRPILIIDEPQSVLGAVKSNKTRERLQQFNPLFYLLYSATHRKDDLYNQVYRLDAIDAFNQHLVKKIEVIGVEQVGTTGTSGFLYLDAIELSKKMPPRARITFDTATKQKVSSKTCWANEGFDLYPMSGELEAYREGFQIEHIDGARGCIRLSSGQEINEGEAIGAIHEETIRRIQIRTTIDKHLKRERQLYLKGIKVLSLFFIDAVEKYRLYEVGGETKNGRWAEIFEEEYQKAVEELQKGNDLFMSQEYLAYLKGISAEKTHAGYFSKDKKGKLIDSKVKRGETIANDPDAYQLIMKDKERLLSLEEPTRFIFSHSALKEGWDNPNVFQICTLKQSNSEVKKRQEVGRGMRLCVDQEGVRQDSEKLGTHGVYDINILTIIASESYKHFSEALQKELAESITSRAMLVTADLFIGKQMVRIDGLSSVVTSAEAASIMEELITGGYVKKQKLTPKYFEDKEHDAIELDEWEGCKKAITQELDKVFDPKSYKVDNGRRKSIAKFREDLFKKKEFQDLWKKINQKTFYHVDFETDNLIEASIKRLDDKLNVPRIQLMITTGTLENISSKEALESGKAMTESKDGKETKELKEVVSSGVRYDLLGELVEKTGLKRSTIAAILQGVKKETFDQYHYNPEAFIINVGNLINEQKAPSLIEHIEYKKTNQQYEVSLFSEYELRGSINVDAIESEKSLYDLVVVDSLGVEKTFAEELERHKEVKIYTKLPQGFYINTPLGKYNPDWAIVFEGEEKHIYFVAETKGSMSDLQLRPIEQGKIECAKYHFKTIANGEVKYETVTSFEDLYNLLNK